MAVIFKVGDRVKCINASNMGTQNEAGPGFLDLKKGREYIVYDISHCPGCGVQQLDVGLILNSASTLCGCGQRELHYVGAAMYNNSKRFVKSLVIFETASEKEVIEQQIQEILYA